MRATTRICLPNLTHHRRDLLPCADLPYRATRILLPIVYCCNGQLPAFVPLLVPSLPALASSPHTACCLHTTLRMLPFLPDGRDAHGYCGNVLLRTGQERLCCTATCPVRSAVLPALPDCLPFLPRLYRCGEHTLLPCHRSVQTRYLPFIPRLLPAYPAPSSFITAYSVLLRSDLPQLSTAACLPFPHRYFYADFALVH